MAKRRGGRRVTRASGMAALPISQKLTFVVKNLIAFLILFAISYIFYKIIPATSIFLSDLFTLLMFVFGFVGLAFFIVWLVLMVLKGKR